MSQKSMPIAEIWQKYYSNIPEEDFIKIASADMITSNLQKDKLGKYAKWLLNLYKRNRLKLEDLYKASKYIAVFDKAAKMNKFIYIDLNYFKSLPEMYRVIKPYLKTTSNSERTQKIKKHEAEKLYEDEAFVVVHPKTWRASALYGKGSQWCTATKLKFENQFQFYNQKGKLYIIIDKRTNKKYQFHAETDSYVNEEDETICENEDWETYTLEKINATEGLCNYLSVKFPNFQKEYSDYLHFKKLKVHPEWKMYCEIFHNGQVYYIAKKNGYCALYNANFEEIIGKNLSANQICVTKTNQPVVIKNQYVGLYYADTGTIRWGYKGVVDQEIDWIKREVIDRIYSITTSFGVIVL